MSRTKMISALAGGLGILAAACWFVTATFPLAAAPQNRRGRRDRQSRRRRRAAPHAGWLPRSGPRQGRSGRCDRGSQARFHRQRERRPRPERPRRAAQGGARIRAPVALHARVGRHDPAGDDRIPHTVGRGRRRSLGGVPGGPAASGRVAGEQARRPSREAQKRTSRRRSSAAPSRASCSPGCRRTSRTNQSEAADSPGRYDHPGPDGADHGGGEGLRRTPDGIYAAGERRHRQRRHCAIQFPGFDAVHVERPPAPSPDRIRVGGNVQQTKLLVQARPTYPPEAKAARVSGVVRLSAVIAKDGAIKELDVISGDPLLVPSATRGGEAVGVPADASERQPGGSDDPDRCELHPEPIETLTGLPLLREPGSLLLSPQNSRNDGHYERRRPAIQRLPQCVYFDRLSQVIVHSGRHAFSLVLVRRRGSKRHNRNRGLSGAACV